MVSMDQAELRRLRRKQVIMQTVLMLAGSLAIIMGMIFLRWPMDSLFALVIVMNLLSVIINYVRKEDCGLFYLLFPSMRPLREYEKEKLGNEWAYIEKQNRVSGGIVIVMFAFMIVMNHFFIHKPAYFLPSDLKLLIPLTLGIVVFSIVYSHFYYRKVDFSTSQELEGLAGKVLVSGIISGALLAGVFIVITVLVAVLIE
ncbi:MAG TPA: hypothetical protein VN426_01330 [Syntrophomonadaceae bacterium]|nr:hypothetical protein [Syntrophomonadaceae bacterium]